MAKFRFNPQDETIILDAELRGKIILHTKLVLDTGASLIILPWRIITGLGLPIDPVNITEITTATTVESCPLTTIPQIAVLGKTARNVPCLVKDLPPESGVDGLLGLSFLRQLKITLDFPKGLLIFE
jgi:predicted aspartyl protease